VAANRADGFGLRRPSVHDDNRERRPVLGGHAGRRGENRHEIAGTVRGRAAPGLGRGRTETGRRR